MGDGIRFFKGLIWGVVLSIPLWFFVIGIIYFVKEYVWKLF